MKLEPITFRCLFLPFDCQLNISEVFFNIEVLKDYFDDKGWTRVLFEYESKIKMSTCSVWDFIFYERSVYVMMKSVTNGFISNVKM